MGLRRYLKPLVDLLLRRLPSEYHASAWTKFEQKQLHQRTFIFMTAMNVHFLLQFFLGTTHLHLFDKYGASKTADQLIFVTKSLFIMLVIGRMIINVLSLKCPRVSKLTFYI